MRRVAGVAIVAASLGSVLAVLLAWSGLPRHAAATATAPVWTEIAWPFPNDPWGKGKAFRCRAADCGAEVNVYLRAKIGFCNCTTGVADDEDLRGRLLQRAPQQPWFAEAIRQAEVLLAAAIGKYHSARMR